MRDIEIQINNGDLIYNNQQTANNNSSSKAVSYLPPPPSPSSYKDTNNTCTLTLCVFKQHHPWVLIQCRVFAIVNFIIQRSWSTFWRHRQHIATTIARRWWIHSRWATRCRRCDCCVDGSWILVIIGRNITFIGRTTNVR